MNIARYWSKAETQARTPEGRVIPLAFWRGSATSPEQADALAGEAAKRVAARIGRGEGFPERYAYADRPLREEILEEVHAPDGSLVAVITRNAYGAEVLNAASALFIDVDLAPPGGLGNLLRRLGHALFGARVAPPRDPEVAARGRLATWLAEHFGWGVRVYRTRSGLRLLATHATFEPGGAESEEAMRALGCDPQYVRLCRAQQSFRARLTPKSWRLGLDRPPVRFPFESEAVEQAMRAWERRYEDASDPYATCALLETQGPGASDPGLAAVVALHDARTRAKSGLPLA